MSAPVRIEAEAWTDLRFATLARALGLADADHALIRTARIWSWQAEHYTPESPTYVVDLDTIESALGSGGAAALVRARLADELPEGFRIRGARGRIEWLYQRRQAARAGGEATKRKHSNNDRLHGQPGGSRTPGPDRRDTTSDYPRETTDEHNSGESENKTGPLGLAIGLPAAEPVPSPLVPDLVPDQIPDLSLPRAIPPSTKPGPMPAATQHGSATLGQAASSAARGVVEPQLDPGPLARIEHPLPAVVRGGRAVDENARPPADLVHSPAPPTRNRTDEKPDGLGYLVHRDLKPENVLQPGEPTLSQLWAELEAARMRAAAARGVAIQLLVAHDDGRRELSEMLAEASRAGRRAELAAQVRHAIAAAEAESRMPPEPGKRDPLQWFTGAIFSARNFRRLVAAPLKSSADAGAKRRREEAAAKASADRKAPTPSAEDRSSWLRADLAAISAIAPDLGNAARAPPASAPTERDTDEQSRLRKEST